MLDYGKQDLNVFCSYSNGSIHLPRTLSSHERTFSMSALDSANQHFSHDICQQMLCFDLYLKVLCNSDKVVSRACRVHLCFILGVFFHTYIRYVSRQWIVIRVLLLNTIPDSEGANQHHFKAGHTDHRALQHLSIYLLIVYRIHSFLQKQWPDH